jgi:hypothetical protein
MAALREHPRLVAARVLAVALLVGVGVAIGVLAADPSSEIPARAQTQLKRAKIVSVERADLLDRSSAAFDRVSAELDEALERTRRLSRSNSRLRRELRAARRALRRAPEVRRSRAG